MYVLRDYQEEATEACVQILESTKQCREIVVCATGDGKSLIQAEVAKRLNFPLIICAPSKELLEQNSKKLTEFGVEHTICSASLGKRDISKLTLATIGSIKNNWEEFKKMGVKGILLDEGHLGVKSGSTVRKFIKQAKIQNVCAITATPCVLESSMAGASIKMLNRTKWKLFTDIRYVHQISDSVKRGFWSPIVYRNIETDETMLQDNSTGSDYTVESQKRFYEANDINGKIVEELRIVQSEGKKSTIIFVPTISEAEELYSKIPNSAIVHSKMKGAERDSMVQAFKNLEIPVIINCGVLCLDLKTEILTKTGWVKHNEINSHHEVANWDNGRVYFEKPENIFKKKLNKEEFMCSYDAQATNFRITNNHNLLYRHQSLGKEWTKGPVEDVINKKRQVPLHGLYTPERVEIEQEDRKLASNLKRRVVANSFNIRKNNTEMSIEESHKIAMQRIDDRESMKYKNPHELTIDECFLVGFFIGDGCVSSHKNNGFRYSISQSKRYPKIIKKIDEILKSCKIQHIKRDIKKRGNMIFEAVSWELSTGTGYGNQKKEGIYSLIPYLNKNGSEYIKFLNKEQFDSLLYGFWMADGNHGDGFEKRYAERGKIIYNTNFKLLNLLQEVAVTRSLKTSIKKSEKPKKEHHKQLYKFSFSNTEGHILNNRVSIKKEKFKEETVWCVKTSSGNIITRRNNKTLIMGNCIGFDHPLLDSMINGKPTKSVNLYYQIVGRIVRIHPKKKEGLVVDMVGNFKRFGKVEDFSFDNIEFYGWGMFGKDGVLLTDYPIASKHRPNKESLVKAGLKREAQEKEKEIDHENNRTNPVVGFGMWSGRKVWDIAKSPDAKRFFGWCGWFLEEQKKPSRYPKNHVLIAAINEYLQKEASEFGTPIKKNLDNRLVINIPNNLF
jgi:DNA repair protein RadD